MTTALILTINHLLSAAVLASLLAAAARGEAGTRKLFSRCLGGGAAGALLLAVLRRATAINRGMVNTAVLSAFILVSLAFLTLLWLPRRRPLAARAAAVCAGLLALYALQPVFLMPGDFALAGMSGFTTEVLRSYAGLAAGLALIALAVTALYRAALSAAQPTVLAGFTSAALLVTTVRAAANVVQFLTARRVIRPGRAVFRLYMAAMNHEAAFTLIIAALAFALIITILITSVYDNRVRAVREVRGSKNPAQIRKLRAARRKAVRWNIAAALSVAFCVFSLTALKAWNEKEVILSPAEPMTVTGGEALIPVAQIEDGHLHRFAWAASDGTETRFIVIKKSDAAYGVGLDACDICGSTGYYERKDGVVCRLCDVVMNKSTIGFKGGCNPVPLAYAMRSGSMVIALADLEAEKGRFK